ncbi:efflux RND transporter periplasmic adaptor subunit [Stakelama saccharophila]|uniref:Efflux RND transporter periplasmic adaptor subunit n=1 Tax=Stakelama saccharophila TaxID=3075605 RepID=A0ABZ0B9X6_9SPHN|nr:efflux RND transporter periplasmic adaptor subunit [Stakelama sp. W311]WNO53875.1 efflux RND transporter periplasmic adaptor subunit [Stakelama sp. W311]
MNYESNRIDQDEPLALPGEGGASRRRWWIIGAIAAAVIIVALAFFTSGSGEGPAGPSAEEAADAQIPRVSVARPGTSNVRRVVTGTGSIAARREMPVGVAGEGGRVTDVLVEPGDWVKANQVLARVDRSVQSQTVESLRAQVRAAQADAQLAQANLDRAKQLIDRGFISKADIDNKTATRDAAAAQVRVAQAQLDEARARNARLDIRAPAAGLVLTRNVEPGQIVSSGSGTLFRVAKGGQMELLAQLSESDLSGLHVGDPAQVTPVGSEESFAGEVWQISPVIDPQTRQGTARIALSYDDALRPGGFASARIIAGASDNPILPESAVLSDNKGNYVYVLDAKNRAVRRGVTIGEVSDEGVSIASGLKGDERVVLSAGAFLSPGQEVKPNLVKMER